MVHHVIDSTFFVATTSALSAVHFVSSDEKYSFDSINSITLQYVLTWKGGMFSLYMISGIRVFYIHLTKIVLIIVDTLSKLNDSFSVLIHFWFLYVIYSHISCRNSVSKHLFKLDGYSDSFCLFQVKI